jgi:hypothetical protein
MNREWLKKEIIPYLVGFSASALAVFSLLAALPPQEPSSSFLAQLRTVQQPLTPPAGKRSAKEFE